MYDAEKQLADYFLKNIEFKKILKAIKEKYESYGDFKGILKIKNPKLEEKNAISGITGESYTTKDINIKLEKFISAFQNTKFADIDFLKVMNIYFNEEIVYKKDKEYEERKKRETFFSDIYLWHKDTKGGEWLEQEVNNGKAYSLIVKEYNNADNKEKKVKLEKELEYVIKAINQINVLKEEKEYNPLPIFAAKISGDPHFFDLDKFSGKILIYAMIYLFDEKYPNNAEERAELYLKSGILIDELSNNTAISGLRGIENNKYKKSWDNFIEEKEYFIVPLAGVLKIDTIEAERNEIFIFENPAVFSYVFNYFKEKNNIILPMICGYGQIKLSSLIIMDKAVKNGIKLYYSGDIDPEGLQIADKLKKRYGENIKLILYTEEVIEKYSSEVNISEISIKKCESIEDENLKKISEKIKKNKKKCFQEAFLNEIIEKITQISQFNLNLSLES